MVMSVFNLLALTLLKGSTSSCKKEPKKGCKAFKGRLLELIDIHTHILPGIDDGSNSLETSLSLLASADEIGIRAAFATPHLYFYNRAQELYSTALQGLDQLRQAAAQKSVRIQIQLGFEVFLQPNLPEMPDLGRFTLGQKGEYLLVELALGQIPNFVEKTCFDLILGGITPILAHPERNLVSSSQLSTLERLVRQGVKLQIEAASLLGQNGQKLKKAGQLLLQRELVSFVASDAHNLKRGFEPMQGAYLWVQRQYGEEKAQQLFMENQKKFLSPQAVQTHLKFQARKT